MSMEQWDGEVCKQCHRRNVIGFHVSDDVWQMVAPAGCHILCTTCFDELAQAAEIVYRFDSLWPAPWMVSEKQAEKLPSTQDCAQRSRMRNLLTTLPSGEVRRIALAKGAPLVFMAGPDLWQRWPNGQWERWDGGQWERRDPGLLTEVVAAHLAEEVARLDDVEESLDAMLTPAEKE